MPKKGENVKEHLCRDCGEKDPNKFYGKMKSQCYRCFGIQQEKYRLSVRDEALTYKGGKCEYCGYNKYRGSLEFHHKDPTQKDPRGLRKFKREKLFAELDKCVLLCANCHREEHAKLRMEEQIDW
jgi:predicted HNH restriction endonuclease